jgi:hypothetical protein
MDVSGNGKFGVGIGCFYIKRQDRIFPLTSYIKLHSLLVLTALLEAVAAEVGCRIYCCFLLYTSFGFKPRKAQKNLKYWKNQTILFFYLK